MANDRRTWELRIGREWAGSALILAISGRIGHVEAMRLDRALDAAMRDATAVILDLSGVDYLSGAGASVLAAAAERSSRNGAIAVCGAQDAVRIALELSGVLERLRVAATRAESLARFKTLE